MRTIFARIVIVATSFIFFDASAADSPLDGWGTSVGVTALRHSSSLINDASIINGKVDVSDSQRYSVKFLAGVHYYFSEIDNNGGTKVSRCVHRILGACWGPFAAIALGGNQVVDMVGTGLMIGFGDPATESGSQSRQFNVGIGYGREFHVKGLAPGFSDGSVPPVGETQVRFRYRDMGVPFIMLTVSTNIVK